MRGCAGICLPHEHVLAYPGIWGYWGNASNYSRRCACHRATALLLRILVGPLWEVMGEKGSIPPYNQEHKTDCKLNQAGHADGHIRASSII